MAEQSFTILVAADVHNEPSATVTSNTKLERDSESGLVFPNEHDNGMKILGTLRI